MFLFGTNMGDVLYLRDWKYHGTVVPTPLPGETIERELSVLIRLQYVLYEVVTRLVEREKTECIVSRLAK